MMFAMESNCFLYKRPHVFFFVVIENSGLEVQGLPLLLRFGFRERYVFSEKGHLISFHFAHKGLL